MDPTSRWEGEAIRMPGRPRPGSHERVIDLRDDPTAPMSGEPPPPEPGQEAPEGILVPIDAWNRMLTQLGNLHEAGQEVADARERAAKAETQVEFLKERVSELRGRLGDAEGTNDPATALDTADDTPADEGDPSTGQAAAAVLGSAGTLARSAYRDWRKRLDRIRPKR